MGKRKEKLEEIKIRVTVEEKRLIKEAAASKNITMTKFILDNTVQTAKRQLNRVQHKEIICTRVDKTEDKIEGLKTALEVRKSSRKKNNFWVNFARK